MVHYILVDGAIYKNIIGRKLYKSYNISTHGDQINQQSGTSPPL